ncbi:MAG: hypothetical protein QJQ54_02860 [Mollicutes bacterium]|nr:MAG: hypothetical protein QJQ54_02860 [Mollicutes bacterium]
MEVNCANVRLIYVVKILNILSKFDIVKSKTLSLQESEISEFLEKIKKNDKA